MTVTKLPTAAQELGVRLKSAREAATMSQAEFAAQLGVPVRSFLEYEKGRILPRPATRRRILAFLDGTEEAAA